jgi:hypothetical protein
MKNPAPYFLWANEARTLRRYWDANAKAWTIDVLSASLFDTVEQARAAADIAESVESVEAVLDRAPLVQIGLTIPTANAVARALQYAIDSPCVCKNAEARAALQALHAAIPDAIKQARYLGKNVRAETPTPAQKEQR